MEHLEKLYSNPNFGTYLLIIIGVLLVLFFIVLSLAIKDGKKERKARLENKQEETKPEKIEEIQKIAEEKPNVEETPVVEEKPNVEETPVVEEKKEETPTPVVEEPISTATSIDIFGVNAKKEEDIFSKTNTDIFEETPTPSIELPIDEPIINIPEKTEEQEIFNKIVEEQKVEKEPTPVVEHIADEEQPLPTVQSIVSETEDKKEEDIFSRLMEEVKEDEPKVKLPDQFSSVYVGNTRPVVLEKEETKEEEPVMPAEIKKEEITTPAVEETKDEISSILDDLY